MEKAGQFDPDRHQPLAAAPWDAGVAHAAIQRIAQDAREAFTPLGLWPNHPNDAPPQADPQTMLYMGAAGVVWALDHLAREGAASPGPSFGEHLPRIQTLNHQQLEKQGYQTRSFLIGDAGILFTQWKLAPSEALLTALADTIASNTADPTLELMWGAPGTMLIALALHRASGQSRWADLFRAGARALEAAYQLDPELGANIWTQDLYGSRGRYIGAVHGFAGNAFALIAGHELLEPESWRMWSSHLAATLEASALRGPLGANWPPAIGDARMSQARLVQHCHGAPGMVTSLAALGEPIDELLLAGGELTWAAGPLAKGANLCHGTAGNGYAFLKLFERTGDGLWLDRARSFAMHAITQSDAEAAQLGRRRYSLWTGDIGLACYLWECTQGTARFPTLDVL